MHHYSKLKLTKTIDNGFYVSFYLGKTRYRFFNAKSIGLDIQPNTCEPNQRQIVASELLLAFRNALNSGWSPVSIQQDNSIKAALEKYKVDSALSKTYKKALEKTRNDLLSYVNQHKRAQAELSKLDYKLFLKYLNDNSTSNSTFNHERRRMSSILESILKPLGIANPIRLISKKREKQALHKPYSDIPTILNEIKTFNHNLYLCCLLTYGCLLRPHQEIRLLKWSDFSEDLSYISLSGKRNKSGRNRVVPVSSEIRKELTRGEYSHNIFTSTEKPFNEEYFKLLWRRFKEVSTLLEEGQTLYSFRHTGAINVFTRTGSLVKLQHVMGHSSLNVTLTYLRGLEVPMIELCDMPEL